MAKFSQLFKKGSKVRALLGALVFVLCFAAFGGGAGVLANNLAKKSNSGSETSISQTSGKDDGKLHAAVGTLTVSPNGGKTRQNIVEINSYGYNWGPWSGSGSNNCQCSMTASTGTWTLTGGGNDPYCIMDTYFNVSSTGYYVMHAEFYNQSNVAITGRTSRTFQVFYSTNNAWNETQSVSWNNSGTSSSFYIGTTGRYNMRWDNDYGATLKIKKFWVSKDTYTTSSYSVSFPDSRNYYCVPDPERTGYTFSSGTYYFSSRQASWKQSDGVIWNGGGSYTVTATWTANSYTIYYYATSPSTSYTTQTVNYDSTYTMPSTPTAPSGGWSLYGWRTSNSTSTSGAWTSGTQTCTGSAWWYAVWSRTVTYTLSYNKNGKTTTTFPSNTSNTGTQYRSCGGTLGSTTVSCTMTSTTPAATGYTFSKWNSATGGGGTNYTAGTSYSQTFNSTNSNQTYTTTIYAIWTTNSYTAYFRQVLGTSNSISCGAATFNGTILSASNQSKSVSYKASVTLIATPKVGYTFDGWYVYTSDAVGSATKLTTKTNYSLTWTYTGARYFYAKFVANTPNVYCSLGGGGYASSNLSISTTYNTAIGTLPTPVREGYTFNGWTLLPQEYQQVEYLISTGSQYFDTGITPGYYTKTSIVMQYNSTTVQQRMFGVYEGDSVTEQLAYESYINGSGYYAFAYKDGAGNWVSSDVTVTTSDKFTIDLDGETKAYTLYLNSNGASKVMSLSGYTATKTANYNLYLLARNYSGSSVQHQASARFYGATISNGFGSSTNNYSIEANYIPCYRKSDNVVGVFDTYRGTFIIPTGTLTYGGTISGYLSSSSIVTVPNNFSIYANWTAKSYTVTANANGGSISSTSGWSGTGNSATKSVTYNSTYGTLPTSVSKTGYTFNGWSLLPDGYTQVPYIQSNGTQYINLDYTPTSSSTIFMKAKMLSIGNYALWCSAGSTLQTSAQSMIFQLTDIYAYYNSGRSHRIVSGVTSTTIDYSKSGNIYYVMNGIVSNFAYASFTSGGPIKLFASYYNGINSNISNYASMELYSFYVYDNNALQRYLIPCRQNSSNKLGLYDIVTNTFYTNSTGDAFETAEDFDSIYLTSSDVNSIIGNHTIYARYTVNKYNVAWKGNATAGTSGLMNANLWNYAGSTGYTSSNSGSNGSYTYSGVNASSKATYNSTLGYYAPIPIRAGYTFNGWYTDPSAGTKVANNDGTLVVSVSGYTDSNKKWIKASDTTLYAQYTAKSYTITFANAGDDATSATSYTVASGATITAPTKAGYTFAGWNITSALDKMNPATIHINTGVQQYDSNYTTAVYYEMFYGMSGITYTGVASGGQIRWRRYNANGTYESNAGTELSLAGANKYIAFWYHLGNSNATTSLSYSISTASNITTSAYKMYGDITLTAIWTVNTYTIRFNNGNADDFTTSGLDAYSELTATYDTAYQISNYVTVISKRGFILSGWQVTSGLNTSTGKHGTAANTCTTALTTTTDIPNANFVKNLTATANGSVTLTAQWTAPAKAVLDQRWNNTLNATATDITSITTAVSQASIPAGAVDVSDFSYPNTVFAKLTSGTLTFYTTASKIYLPANSSYIFSDGLEGYANKMTNLASINVSNFDSSEVTNMNYMFSGCTNLASITGLNNFTSIALERCTAMFGYCSSLTSLTFGSNFTTSNVISMTSMFKNCTNLASITGLDYFTSVALTECSGMFQGCSSLTSLTFGNGFPTASVTDIQLMFCDCSSLVTLNIGSFRVGSSCTVTNMLTGCSSLKKIYCPATYSQSTAATIYDGTIDFYDITKAITTPFTTLSSSTNGKTIVRGYAITYNTNGETHQGTYDNVYLWSTGTAAIGYASKTGYLQTVASNIASSSITNGITSAGTLTVPTSTASAITVTWTWSAPAKAVLSQTWNTTLGATATSITAITTAVSQSSIPDGVTDVSDSSYPKTVYAKLTSGTVTYYTIASKIYLPANSTYIFSSGRNSSSNTMTNLATINVTNFDTSEVEDMSYMFSGCTNLSTITGLNILSSASLTSVSYMFSGCSSITELEFGSGFTASGVNHLDRMFINCTSLEILNIRSFNITEGNGSHLQTLDGCQSLLKIYCPTAITGYIDIYPVITSLGNGGSVVNHPHTYCDITKVDTTQYHEIKADNAGKTIVRCWGINYVLNNGSHTGTYDSVYLYSTGTAAIGYAMNAGYTPAVSTNIGSISGGLTSNGTLTVPTNTTCDSTTITITWTWTVQRYAITLNVNGATTGSNQTVYAEYNNSSIFAESTGSSLAEIVNPSRTGYNFLGWTATQNGSDTVIVDGGWFETSVSGYTNSSRKWIHDGSVTLYAKWQAISYRIYFNANGSGTFTTSGLNTNSGQERYVDYIYFDSAIQISTYVTAISKNGYMFGGWKVSGSDFDGTTAKYGSSNPPTIALTTSVGIPNNNYVLNLSSTGGTVTLTAQWLGYNVYPQGYPNQIYQAAVFDYSIRLLSYEGTDTDLVINRVFVNASDPSITYTISSDYTLQFYNNSSTSDRTYYTKRASITSFTVVDTAGNPVVFSNTNTQNSDSYRGFYELFYDCTALTNVSFGNATTTSITSVGNMFYNCTSLQILDIGSLYISSSCNVSNMLTTCSGLLKIVCPSTQNRSDSAISIYDHSTYYYDINDSSFNCKYLPSASGTSRTIGRAYNVTIAKNYPSGGNETGTGTAVYGANYLISINVGRPSGYVLESIYSAPTGGTKIIDVDQNSFNKGDIVPSLTFGTCISNGRWCSTTVPTLYARWSEYGYKIRFAPNSATTFTATGLDASNTTGNIDPESVIQLSNWVSAIERTGYTLLGWQVTSGTIWSSERIYAMYVDTNDLEHIEESNVHRLEASSVIATDWWLAYLAEDGETITFTAQWQVSRYELTLNPQGGRVGVIFSDSSSIASSTSNATVYAEYNSTVLYKASTGDVTVSTITTTKDGYTHLGYYTAASAGTKVINASTAGALISAFTGTTATTYHAQWQANRFTITLNPQGGSVGVTFSDSSSIASSTSNATVYAEYNSTVLYKASTGAVTVSTITTIKNGYIHLGYYTAASAGTKVINASTAGALISAFTGTAATTYHAQWQALQYTITFNSNNATTYTTAGLTSNSFTASFDTAYKINTYVTAIARNGYTFEGWRVSGSDFNNSTAKHGSTNPPASGVTTTTDIPNTDYILNLCSTNGGSVTLTARWSGITYDILYQLNNGTHKYGASGNTGWATSYTTGESQQDKNIGWATRAGYTPVISTNKGTITTGGLTSDGNLRIPANTYGDITITWTWTGIEYDILYQLNDGTHKYGDANTGWALKYTTSETQQTKNVGWATRLGYSVDTVSTSQGTITSNKTSNETLTIPANTYGDITITWTWTGIEYDILYQLNNGTHKYGDANTGWALKYTTGESQQTKNVGWATRPGYTVNTITTSQGSVTSNKTSNETLTIPANTYGDITITWTWTGIEYNILYQLNNGTHKYGVSGNTGWATTYTTGESQQTKNVGWATRTGYTISTVTTSQGSVTSNKTSNETLTIPANTYGDITITWTWQANTYQITYVLDGGTHKYGNANTGWDATYTFSESAQTANIGWAEKLGFVVDSITASAGTITDGVTSNGTLNIPASNTGDITITWTWRANGRITITSTYTNCEDIAMGFVKITDSSSHVWRFMLNRGETYDILGVASGNFTAVTSASINHEAKISGNTTHNFSVDGNTVTLTVAVTPKAVIQGGFYSSNVEVPSENTYSITYVLNEGTHYTGRRVTSGWDTQYTSSSAAQTKNIGWAEKEGYNVAVTTNVGTIISGITGDGTLNIPANATGNITITYTWTEKEWYEYYACAVDNSAHTITLTDYIGSDAVVNIPGKTTIDGIQYQTIIGKDYEVLGLFSGEDITSVTMGSDGNDVIANDCEFMFMSCEILISVDLTHLDTSSVTNMDYMFYGCSSLEEVDLSNLDTSAVTDMSYMFSGCSSLTSLDLSNFNTENVTNMHDMFEDCSLLETLDLSSFIIGAGCDVGDMLSGCTSLLFVFTPAEINSDAIITEVYFDWYYYDPADKWDDNQWSSTGDGSVEIGEFNQGLLLVAV